MKEPIQDVDYYLWEVTQEIVELHLTPPPPLTKNMVLNSKVYMKTRKKDYMENLIKWLGKDDANATWVEEVYFKRLGIDFHFLNPRLD